MNHIAMKIFYQPHNTPPLFSPLIRQSIYFTKEPNKYRINQEPITFKHYTRNKLLLYLFFHSHFITVTEVPVRICYKLAFSTNAKVQ